MKYYYSTVSLFPAGFCNIVITLCLHVKCPGIKRHRTGFVLCSSTAHSGPSRCHGCENNRTTPGQTARGTQSSGKHFHPYTNTNLNSSCQRQHIVSCKFYTRHLYFCQVGRNHASEPQLFSNLLMKLPELRTLGAKHSAHLDWFRVNWAKLTLPPLFAEIFDIPKCEEDLQ